eukprot:TRINITY_DN8266_c0_g1_i2.p1 TRINITY_DN8266_c0_g1~~TRINITY_DN8266_c0_g1_i2.p1  ORF type:complete len:409 (-),score=79.36 TRINITY_DN8266_c0_g1_i2:56-1282(-)
MVITNRSYHPLRESSGTLLKDLIKLMSPGARAKLVLALCPTFSAKEDAIQNLVSIITQTRGNDLWEFKNLLDFIGEYNNMHRIVYQLLDVCSRNQVLNHIQEYAPAFNWTIKGGKPLKILSDVDDTFISSGGKFPAGIDRRFSAHTPYPGIFAFYREMDRGKNDELHGRQCNLAFLSARPHAPGGVSEEVAYKMFRDHIYSGRLHTSPILLAGDFNGLTLIWGNFEPISEKKKQNFAQYASLFPECNFVFIGDNGQGDYKAAYEMLQEHENLLDVFIHKVQPVELTYGWEPTHRHPRIHFFDTYVGAACTAYTVGYIDEEGLENVIVEAQQDFLFLLSNHLSRKQELNSSPHKSNIFLRLMKISSEQEGEETSDFAFSKEQLNNDILLANTLIPHNPMRILEVNTNLL